MPGRVVCNSSPLIFLAKIDRLDLLNDYELYIPSHVEIEILKGFKNKRENAKKIIEYFQNNKIKSIEVTILKDIPHSLGAGERAVISLAVKENIKKVLLDETKARTIARFKGLNPKGTLGVLWDSYKSARLDRENLKSLSFDLIQKGYRIREEIFIEFLRNLEREKNID